MTLSRNQLAAISDYGGQEVERPYNVTFNAIAKAVTVNADGSIGISARAFWEAFDEYTSAPQPASMALIERLTKALEPFAKCADEIDYDDKERDEPTPDDEWAKFRLLVGDYRRARTALSASQPTSREGER